MKNIRSSSEFGANLDPKVRRELHAINLYVFRKACLKFGQLIIHKVDDSRYREAEESMRSAATPAEAKRALKNALKMGGFTPVETDEINEKFEAYVDWGLTETINEAIRKGKIPPPSKGVRPDEFTKKMNQRIPK